MRQGNKDKEFRKMKRVAACLAFVFLCGFCYAQQKSVAVSTFTNGRDISSTDADFVTNFVIGRLTDNGMVRVVDRASFDKIIEEMRFQSSDWSDREKTAALGRAANADYIIRGEINTVDGLIFITARMIDINTAAVVASSDVEMERMNQIRARMPEFVERFLQTLSRTGGSGVQAAAAAPVSPSGSPVPPDFVYIPGGTFTMGSPASEPGRDGNEALHTVTVGSFYMGKFEVTQREWVELMDSNPSDFKGDNLPVEMVSWYETIEYCNRRSQQEGLTPAYTIDKGRSDPNNTDGYDDVKWLVTWDRNTTGYRLPTEAEWEYACRGGTATPFFTGDNITTNHANYNGNYPYNNNARGVYRERTWNVGSGMPNPYGLSDMHGNVWEWCWDWYGAYPSSAQTDPRGAASGSYRVLRGGGWYDSAGYLRSAYRGFSMPSPRREYPGSGGFRLVRS
jgi:formylglycine-generating enzyme required for sulfatase activity